MQNDECRTSLHLCIPHFAVCIVLFAAIAPAFAAPPVVRIPFNSANGLIEVPARVNGVRGSFLLDTAADYSVVDPRLVDGPQVTIETGRSGRAFVDDVTIEVGGIRFEHQRVLVKASESDVS